MTLIIALNIIGCLGVVAAIVGSLAWAIRTQHRNHPVAVSVRTTAQPPVQPRPTRDPRARRHERPALSTG